jgi:fatty-acid peroxygenase
VTPGAFDFVPQGGATAAEHHRCPGEDFTIALMMLSIRLLGSLSYELPAQDLAIDMRRMPALPRAGLLIAGLRAP